MSIRRVKDGTSEARESQLRLELEQEEAEITRIQRQREHILKLQESFLKKQQEIGRLQGLVEKYRPSYELIADRDAAIKTITKENQVLKRQFQELLNDSQSLSDQLRIMQLQKQSLLRERHSIERVNREIEQTFKEYQSQCRRREQELLQLLDEERRTSDAVRVALQEMKSTKLSQNNSQGELKQAMIDLGQKQKQLQKVKLLNHELSIQFDKSVNKICEFQRELNNYRVENHELKKTLGLVLQQDKMQKLHSKYLQGKKPKLSQESEEQQDEEQEDQSSPELSDVKF